MDKYTEIEITDAKGNKFYEITTSKAESFQLMRLHNGISMGSRKPLKCEGRFIHSGETEF